MNRLLGTLLILVVLSSVAQAIPITRIYGEKTQSLFIKKYFERLQILNTASGTRINEHLSTQEKQLFELWKQHLATWGVAIDENHLLYSFYFEHTVRDGKLLKPTLFIGAETWPESAKALILEVAKARGKALTDQELTSFYGFAWNLENNSFEVHYLHMSKKPLTAFKSFLKLSENHNQPQWTEVKKYIEVFDSQKKWHSEKCVFPLAHLDLRLLPRTPATDVLSAQKVIDKEGSVTWILDLRSFMQTLLHPASRQIVRDHSTQFFLFPDSMIFKDFNNYTLYYP